MNKHSRKLIAPLACCTLIITDGAYLFKQMYAQHETNAHIIEQCFQNFDTTGQIAVHKDDLTASLICEK